MYLFSKIIQIADESKSALLFLSTWNSSREILVKLCIFCNLKIGLRRQHTLNQSYCIDTKKRKETSVKGTAVHIFSGPSTEIDTLNRDRELHRPLLSLSRYQFKYTAPSKQGQAAGG